MSENGISFEDQEEFIINEEKKGHTQVLLSNTKKIIMAEAVMVADFTSANNICYFMDVFY